MEVRRESSWELPPKPEPLRWMRPEVPVDGPEPDGARALKEKVVQVGTEDGGLVSL